MHFGGSVSCLLSEWGVLDSGAGWNSCFRERKNGRKENPGPERHQLKISCINQDNLIESPKAGRRQ